MKSLIISLSDNFLKITNNDDKGFKGITVELSSDVCNGTTILNVQKFAQALSSSIAEFTGAKVQKSSLNFLIEPQDVILKFVTVNKKNGNPEDQIIPEIKNRLEGDELNDLYFSYSKIAPFVYQFIAIKKEILQKYMEVCNLLGVSLNSVIPWISLFPKVPNNGNPCIFIAKNTANLKQVIALSELNGIYFCGVYDKDKTSNELHALVQELSVYKRATPITKIYTLNYESFSLDPSYQVEPLFVPGFEFDETKGYEIHVVTENIISNNVHLLSSQLNLLNLVPVPVVQKPPSLVYVGGAMGSLMIVGVAALAFTFVFKPDISKDWLKFSSKGGDKPVVLSDSSSNESSQSSSSVNSNNENEPKPDLKKSDLKFRVENGAGVTGIAAKAKDVLQSAGYNVTEIGNADKQDRQNTLLKLKTGKIDYKDMLINDLKGKYTVVVENGLPEDSTYDALLIVGSN